MNTIQPGRIEPQTKRTTEGGRETSDIFLPGLIVFLVFMAFAAFVIHAGIWGWLKTLRGKRSVDAVQSVAFRPVEQNAGIPALQITPRVDWEEYRREQNELLNNYKWIDRKAGLVRVPIEKAIDTIVSNGLPRWGPDRPISSLELQRSRAEGAQK